MNLETKVTAEMTIREIAAAVLEFSLRGQAENETYITDWLAEGEIVGATIGELVADWDEGLDEEGLDEEEVEAEEEWDESQYC